MGEFSELKESISESLHIIALLKVGWSSCWAYILASGLNNNFALWGFKKEICESGLEEVFEDFEGLLKYDMGKQLNFSTIELNYSDSTIWSYIYKLIKLTMKCWLLEIESNISFLGAPQENSINGISLTIHQ